MDWLPDLPAVVLLALTLAAALLLVEVALPTLGVAGTAALVLAVWAVALVDRQGYAWWPLMSVVAAVCVWAVLLTRRRASVASQAVAAVLFGAGSTAYGLLADDPATVAVGLVGAGALAAGFRPLLASTRRLLELPHQTGMDALIGRTGVVTSWADGRGTVRIDGSLWNARDPRELAPGTEVTVRGFSGMTVEVALRTSIP
ncbi:MAG TPA: NfeD family protein [Acidimicrobiales bacterium]|nr:NfeD family protein [Acidimicrobiales bacterium]